MADELTEKFRKLCEDSEKRIRLPDFKAVRLAYGQSQPSDKLNRTLLDRLLDRLETLIKSTDRTEISTHTLLIAARTFGFERMTGVSNQNWDGVLRAIRLGFHPYFHPLDHRSWPEAIDIARAILILHPFLKSFDGRYKHVAEAAKRLRDQNVKLRAESGKFVFDDGELERATKQILNAFSMLGLSDVMEHLFAQIKSSREFWNGIYLFARDYSTSDRKPKQPITESPTMRSFAFNGITIPVAFKATCSRRAQLWNRQASIIMDLTTLALRHGWRRLPISALRS